MPLFKRDVIGGFLLVVAGAAFWWLGLEHSPGTASQMGPGYFPRLLSVGLALLGIVICMRGAVSNRTEAEPVNLRPLFFVLASTVLFGLLIGRLGFLPTAMISLLLGAAGGQEFRWAEAAVFAVLLSIAAAVLFIYLLGLPLALFAY